MHGTHLAHLLHVRSKPFQETSGVYTCLTAFFPFWISMKQETTEWQWHQLDHMEIICTSLQTTTPAPHHSIFTGWMIFLTQPKVSKH